MSGLLNTLSTLTKTLGNAVIIPILQIGVIFREIP